MYKPYIFLAIDALLQRIAIRKQLSERGLKVKEITSSEELFSALNNEQPDLVLLDYSLAKTKGESGLKPLDIIKQDPTLENIPFFILVNEDDTFKKSYFVDLDVNTFLTKPIDDKILDLELKRLENQSLAIGKPINNIEANESMEGLSSEFINDQAIYAKIENISTSIATIIAKKQAQQTTETVAQGLIDKEIKVIAKEAVNAEIKEITEKIYNDLKKYARNDRIPEEWGKRIKAVIKDSMLKHRESLQDDINKLVWKKLIIVNGCLFIFALSILLTMKLI